MVRPRQSDERKERHSGKPTTTVRQHPKKEGGGGRYTMGKLGEYGGGATVDRSDPNHDPDERRVAPDDGVAYKFEEIYNYYKAKYTAQEIAEYWEYYCKPMRRRYRVKVVDEQPAGPSLAESAALAAKPKPKGPPRTRKSTEDDLEAPKVQEVAAVIPCHALKNGGKYYHVHGLLGHPTLLKSVCAVIAKRLRSMSITKLAVFGARGLFFTPVCVGLNLPLVMLHKKSEMLSDVEVESVDDTDDAYCVEKHTIVEGDKVALLDDFLDTGSALCAGIALLKKCGAEVTECACILGLPSGHAPCLTAGARSVWSFMSEDDMTEK